MTKRDVPVFKETPPATEEAAADKPAFEPPRAKRPHFSRNGILALVAILLALFALFRVYQLLCAAGS